MLLKAVRQFPVDSEGFLCLNRVLRSQKENPGNELAVAEKRKSSILAVE